MRVVAGTAKGLRLVSPTGRDTRPTTDRVREAIFNALGSLDVVVGATVADLYAGSGALGIEALSRGAHHATFLDTDRKAIAAIRDNLATTGLVERATVLPVDASRWDGAVDLALLDPPYATDDAAWRSLLSRLDAVTVVTESDRELDVGQRWQVLRSKRYGSTVVQIATRKGPE